VKGLPWLSVVFHLPTKSLAAKVTAPVMARAKANAAKAAVALLKDLMRLMFVSSSYQ
jgi:hypothetical protein